MKTILLVDDDSALNDLLGDYLGEDFQVVQAFDGEQGWALFVQQAIDLAIVDVMMPKLDGIGLLKRIRRKGQTPVIMLTAKTQDIDRILGLELGADDYLSKPCHPRELRARVNNILQRSQVLPEQRADVVDIQWSSRTLLVGGEALALTNVEFELIALLYQHLHSVVSKDELHEQVFGRKLQPFERTIDVHISNIRKKIAHTPLRVITVRNKGYQLAQQTSHAT